MTEEFAQVPLRIIVASLTNPRKTFDPVTLLELSESIKASGVHQPVLLRPLPGERVADTDRAVEYELVAGERRYRASQMAGLVTIPALIRPLTDQQVLEVQIVENLQRDDLTELEEAEGYDRLIQHTGMNVDAVADKIKKSRSYVFARLKLLDLSQECKQAMRDGKIEASHAVLIARIPDSTLQTKALAEATRPIGIHGDQVISVRAFQSWLQANVMLRLDAATFTITDKRLVASAGSCKDCPKRTGANPDLFVDVSSADICTDPVCFHGKADAHRAALIARAAKNGQTFIEGKEARDLIAHQYTSRIDGYCPLSQVRNDVAPEHKGKTMRELLGRDAPGAVLIENPYTKELIEAVPEEEAEAMLLAKGLLKAVEVTESKADLAKSLERLEQHIKTDTFRAVRYDVFEATVQAVRATSAEMAATILCSSHFLRAFLHSKIDIEDEMTLAQALGYSFEQGEDEVDGLTMHIKACSVADLQRAAIIMMIQDDWSPHYNDTTPLMMDALVQVLDVPAKAITKSTTRLVLAEHAQERADLQKRIDTLKATEVPAAPVASKTKLATNPAKRNRKINAEEAQAGIAEAMQANNDAMDAAIEQGQADPMLDEAIALVRMQNKASISLVQRHLKIGYNRAALLMEAMEADGVCTPMDCSGARQVIICPGPGDSFAIGQTVRITTDDNRLGPIARKHGGKTGTITRREDGGGYWDVTFKGRGGGVAMFAEDQMEALQL